MTDYRPIDQVRADFLRRDPHFAPLTNLGTLIGILTDDPLGDAAVYASGGGAIVYDLGILDGPEWEGVRRFLNDSSIVAPELRTQIAAFESHLRAADLNGDGFVNNPEIVTYAQAHVDRWPNVATFRNAADVLVNRLPAYLSQANPAARPSANLDDRQISRLWGVMNFLAKEYDALQIPEENRGTVYGISLAGFPSQDSANPPSLIRRAMEGTLTPEELAAVHQILRVNLVSGNAYEFSGTAPLTPKEIGALGQILDAAAARGDDFQGMTLVAGDAEKTAFAARNEAAAACSKGIDAAATANDSGALAKAFQDCATSMAGAEADHPELLSVTALLARAYTGDLSPAETRMLREWMVKEADKLGLTCDGTLDCLLEGSKQVFKSIARDPWHFLARNGAFIGGTYLYRRLFLRNAFQRRFETLCGGTLANPRQAYRDYENYVADRMKNAPLWKRALNQLVNNPRHKGFLGKTFLGFPVTFLHLAAFNYIAGKKDTGNLAVDVLTDLPLVALFQGWDTYDALRNPMLNDFASQNSGLCRPVEAPEVEVSPEMVVEEQPAEATQSEFSMLISGTEIEERFPGVVSYENGGLIYRYQAEIDGVPVGLTQPLASRIAQSRGLRFDPESFFDAGEFTATEFAMASGSFDDETAGYDMESIRAVAYVNERSDDYSMDEVPAAAFASETGAYSVVSGSPIVFAAPSFTVSFSPVRVPITVAPAPVLVP